MVRLRIRFGACLVSGYLHVFIPLSVVTGEAENTGCYEKRGSVNER